MIYIWTNVDITLNNLSSIQLKKKKKRSEMVFIFLIMRYMFGYSHPNRFFECVCERKYVRELSFWGLTS